MSGLKLGRLLGRCCTAALLTVTPGLARAVDLPAPFSFEAGPLGTLQLSGGADAYVYALTGAGNGANPGLLNTSKSGGAEFLNGLIQLQKPDGLVRFYIEAGAINSLTLGTKPTSPSVQTFSTGPLRTVYVTLAPINGLTVSAGQMSSLEGYESSIDWKNYNMMFTSLWYVQNSQSVGASATYTYGPVSGTVMISDGFDTNVWNYVQVAGTYTINDNNNLNLYGATNMGRTGLGVHFYGNANTSYNDTTVGSAGAANLVNSSVVGAYYSFTRGNFTVVPEVQYVWAKEDHRIGLEKYSSHFGAALFADYKFGDSPFSLGGWVQYFSSNGPDSWFLNARSQGFGMVVGPTWSPEWAKKHLFVRGEGGWLHLTKTGTPGSVGYGSSGTGRNQATFVVEAGVLF